MSYKAFICYRRDDWGFARAIEQKLTEKLGPDSVFLDVDDVKPSQDWKQRVENVMSDEPVVLTLVTPKWNPRVGFRRKLMRNDDLVRLELEMALARRLPIVPVHDERAPWPKAKEVPISLASVLDRNNVGISQTRFDYDTGRLVDAVGELLAEAERARKKRAKKEAAEAQAEKERSAGRVPRRQPMRRTEAEEAKPARRDPRELPQRDWIRPAEGGLVAGTGARTTTPFATGTSMGSRPTTQWPLLLSNYQETPEQKREREAKLEAERERIERARRSAPAFYERGQFWLSVLVTLVLGVAALVGAEMLARAVGEIWTTLPDPPLVMAVVLVLTWVGVRSGVAGFAFWSDPEEGSKVFYTRGILGGYTLAISDYEPAGYWAAFPIATVFAWDVARAVAWVPYHFWDWSYGLIFDIVLSVITLVIAATYVFLTYDEVETDYLMS